MSYSLRLREFDSKDDYMRRECFIVVKQTTEMASTGAALDIQAHYEALQVSSLTLVNGLVDLLGKTLTAYVASSPNVSTVEKWQAGESVPSDTEVRLRFAYRVAKAIANKYSPAVAQAWLQGVNPELDDRVAIRLIREGEPYEVQADILAAESVFLDR
jgi:hypothetical protein